MPLLREGANSWYFIAVDYSFGHSIVQEATNVIQTYGGKVSGSVFYPFPGTTDYSTYLLQGQASGASVILNAKRYASYEPEIRELAQDYVSAMRGRGTVDLVDALTYEFPARVVFLLLGLPNVDPIRIKRWGDNRSMMIWGRLSADQLVAAGKELNDFFHFCRTLVHDRIENPCSDYPSHPLAIRNGDDAILTINEIVCLIFGLLLAGYETTANATSNVLLALLTHREQWEQLVRDPSLIPNAVEEGVRYSSSVANWRRLTLEDVE